MLNDHMRRSIVTLHFAVFPLPSCAVTVTTAVLVVALFGNARPVGVSVAVTFPLSSASPEELSPRMHFVESSL